MYIGTKIKDKYGEGYVVSTIDPHNLIIVYEKTGEVKTFCSVRNCQCKEKLNVQLISIPENFKIDMFQTNSNLKYEIRKMQLSLEEKNKSLDALHYVWCDGGCDSGVHRYTGDKSEITEELVQTLERESRRLRRWYENYKFKKLPHQKKIAYFKSWKHEIRMFLNKLYWKLL